MAQRSDRKPEVRKMLNEGATPAEIAGKLELSVDYVRQVRRESKTTK